MDDLRSQLAAEQERARLAEERASQWADKAARTKQRLVAERGHREAVQKVADVVLSQISALESQCTTLKGLMNAAMATLPSVLRDADLVVRFINAVRDELTVTLFQGGVQIAENDRVRHDTSVTARVELRSAGKLEIRVSDQKSVSVDWATIKTMFKTWGVADFTALPFKVRARLSPDEKTEALWVVRRVQKSEHELLEQFGIATQFPIDKHRVLSTAGKAAVLKQYMTVEIAVDHGQWEEAMGKLGCKIAPPVGRSVVYEVCSRRGEKRNLEWVDQK